MKKKKNARASNQITITLGSKTITATAKQFRSCLTVGLYGAEVWPNCDFGKLFKECGQPLESSELSFFYGQNSATYSLLELLKKELDDEDYDPETVAFYRSDGVGDSAIYIERIAFYALLFERMSKMAKKHLKKMLKEIEEPILDDEEDTEQSD